MAVCRTCGAEIEVPEGWSVGPAVRKHYWNEHPQRMEGKRADRAAEESIPAPDRKRRAPQGATTQS